MTSNFEDALLDRLEAIASGLGIDVSILGTMNFNDRVLAYLDAINENLPSGGGSGISVYGWGRFSVTLNDEVVTVIPPISPGGDDYAIAGLIRNSGSNVWTVQTDGLYHFTIAGRPSSFGNFTALNLYVIDSSGYALTAPYFTGALLKRFAAGSTFSFQAWANTSDGGGMDVTGTFGVFKVA